ncbi:MAG: hypothetical protein A2017_05895 [Lentisphaerae bacterium GWF2_44_16]|nr:MAG: hypothetical protein A2017_05895 [Lentisphaerae bacterium GWF2_44_16]
MKDAAVNDEASLPQFSFSLIKVLIGGFRERNSTIVMPSSGLTVKVKQMAVLALHSSCVVRKTFIEE